MSGGRLPAKRLSMPVTAAHVIGLNKVVLVGPQGCALAGMIDGAPFLQPFLQSPVAAVDLFGQSMLVVSPEGAGQMVHLGGEFPTGEAEVGIGSYPGLPGVVPDAVRARDGSGRTAVILDGGQGLQIRNAALRRLRPDLVEGDPGWE